MGEFPDNPAEMSNAWLSGVLGTEVTGFTAQRIGTGQVGDTYRIAVTVGGDIEPRSLAAKFAASDRTSRATAGLFGLYTKEVMFYRSVAGAIAARTPAVHFAGVSEDGTQCLLIFEDLAPARQGDQVAGCDVADARLAVTEAARIHGSSWGRADLLGADWIAPVSGLAAVLTPAYAQAQTVFRDRYADVLPDDDMAVCEGLAAQAGAWFSRPTERLALVHGDYRLDNMLFDIHGGSEPLAILDWQTVSAGNPLTDLGYFMGCGIGTELRRAHEAELLALYRARMSDFGVNFQDSVFERDYSIGALHGVATAVFSAANVERTERGDANFLSMARGACSLARDRGSLSTLAELTGC